MAFQSSFSFYLRKILPVLSILMLGKAYAQYPAIDKDHHDKVANCGKLPGAISSRIINGEKSRVHYPWVVLVVRYYKGKEAGTCGGSILTKRLVNIYILLQTPSIYIS